MDPAATQLTDIKFTERKRGYDPEEVDNFLERLGDAVVKLQDKVREANRRADEAERRATEADDRAAVSRSGEDEMTETIKRTLVLAQKTADEAVSEAKDDAEKILAEAKQKSMKLLEDANRDAAKKLADAERDAKAKAEAERAAAREQVSRLDRVRSDLAGDVERLESYLRSARSSIRSALSDFADLLEHPEKFRAPEKPALSGTEVPAEALAPAATPKPSNAPAAASSEPPTPTRHERPATAAPDPSRPTMSGPPSALNRPPATGTAAGSIPGGSTPGGSHSPRPTAAPAPGATPPSARSSSEPSVDAHSTTNDREFIDDLRKAVVDESVRGDEPGEEEALGELDAEADAAMQAFFATGDEDKDDQNRPRFGRRR